MIDGITVGGITERFTPCDFNFNCKMFDQCVEPTKCWPHSSNFVLDVYLIQSLYDRKGPLSRDGFTPSRTHS